MRSPAIIAVVVAALAAAPLASARVILGIHGDAARFAAQTGQASQIRHTFVGFDQGGNLAQIVSTIGPVPLLALNAGAYGAHESATPQGLAMGRNDQFLFQLNAQIDAWNGARIGAPEQEFADFAARPPTTSSSTGSPCRPSGRSWTNPEVRPRRNEGR